MSTLLGTLRQFAHTHDDLPAFHAAYLVLTFLIAAMFNMGAFAVLIIAHVSLDVVKYREVHRYPWRAVFEGALRESLVDLVLFFLGLTFAVYLHHSLVGIASLSGLARADVTLIRAFATFVPKFEILHHFLTVVSHVRHYLYSIHSRMGYPWSSVEYLCFFSLALSMILLLGAPFILHLDMEGMERILVDELIPWRI